MRLLFPFWLIFVVAAELSAQVPRLEPKHEVSRIRLSPPDPGGPHVTIDGRSSSAWQSATWQSSEDEFQRIVAQLDPAKLHPLEPGTWEAEVLAGAQVAIRKIVNLPFTDASAPMLFTRQEQEGDLLIARWIIHDPQRREKTIWLWDTPFYTEVMWEVLPEVIAPAQLVPYCEHMFAWYDQSALGLRSLKLAYRSPGARKTFVIGQAEHLSPPIAGMWSMWFEASSGAHLNRLKVRVSKPVLAEDYPNEACFIRERFPPLRTRLSGLDRQALFQQLADEHPLGGYPRYESHRNPVVLRELLLRGQLSEAELRLVIFDSGHYYNRLHALINVLEERKELSSYASMLASALPEMPIPRGLEDNTIAPVFGAMDRANVDFSQAALRFLRQGRCARSCLFYLGSTVNDEATLHELESVPVGQNFEDSKQREVLRIKERLRRVGGPK